MLYRTKYKQGKEYSIKILVYRYAQEPGAGQISILQPFEGENFILDAMDVVYLDGKLHVDEISIGSDGIKYDVKITIPDYGEYNKWVSEKNITDLLLPTEQE